MLIFDGSGEQETLREYCELSEKYAEMQYDNVLAYLAKKEELGRLSCWEKFCLRFAKGNEKNHRPYYTDNYREDDTREKFVQRFVSADRYYIFCTGWLREIMMLGHASTDVDVYMTIRGRRSMYRRFLESKGV